MKDNDQILLENLYSGFSKTRNLMYSWMDPSGSIVHNSGEGHFSSGKKILETKYNIPLAYMTFANQVYDILFSKGWMRLTYIGSELYCHNNKMRPNQKQLKEMKNLAIENNMSNIYFDDERGESYHSIWSSE
jgi:hypothetical protein